MTEYLFNPQENVLLCHLHGRYGTETNESFSNQLFSRMAEAHESVTGPGGLKVCLDLGDVSYIASSFIRTCVLVSKQLNPGNFSMVHAAPIIKKTFKIAGLDKELNVD
jgi:anti-anti-sigma factor